WIKTIDQRLESHPVSAALLCDGCIADVDEPTIAEPAALQPAQSRVAGGDVPHVGHAAVALARRQRITFRALHYQCLQHQLAAGPQATLQLQQMIYGRAAVVENAHGEYRIESTYLVGDLVERGRKNVNRGF